MRIHQESQTGREQGFTWTELAVVVMIVGVLWVYVFYGSTCYIDLHGSTIKRRVNAREVYMGLIAYSMDHDGKFPSTSPDGQAPNSSNAVFRNLIPKYVPTEKTFSASKSLWTPRVPDEVITPGHLLARGENCYAYVPNVSGTLNPSFPIIADGFKKGAPGTYSLLENTKGFVGSQMLAVVVRLDGSAALEHVEKADQRVYGLREKAPKGDLFEISPNWLAPNQVPLNPE
jgi:type II secretory pathway pseudopilin PulG